jgi:hypothetical protein
MERWYPLWEIRFTKPQMRFLIEHMAELKRGEWPPQPGNYVRPLKHACKPAQLQGYAGLCAVCPIKPCLSPGEKTPGKVRLERRINRTLEIAAEVDSRLALVMDYISGWFKPTHKVYRNGRGYQKLPLKGGDV